MTDFAELVEIEEKLNNLNLGEIPETPVENLDMKQFFRFLKEIRDGFIPRFVTVRTRRSVIILLRYIYQRGIVDIGGIAHNFLTRDLVLLKGTTHIKNEIREQLLRFFSFVLDYLKVSMPDNVLPLSSEEAVKYLVEDHLKNYTDLKYSMTFHRDRVQKKLVFTIFVSNEDLTEEIKSILNNKIAENKIKNVTLEVEYAVNGSVIHGFKLE